MVVFPGDCKAFYLRLREGMELARQKHPVFAEGKYHALGVIGEEYRELEKAITKEGDIRSVEEAWDVLLTCARFILGEHRVMEGGEPGFGWEKKAFLNKG